MCLKVLFQPGQLVRFVSKFETHNVRQENHFKSRSWLFLIECCQGGQMLVKCVVVWKHAGSSGPLNFCKISSLFRIIWMGLYFCSKLGIVFERVSISRNLHHFWSCFLSILPNSIFLRDQRDLHSKENAVVEAESLKYPKFNQL